MNDTEKLLIKLCEENTFSDSEDESVENDKKKHIVIKLQPKNSQINTVDLSNNKSEEEFKNTYEWENIEYEELDDMVFVESSSTNMEKKGI